MESITHKIRTLYHDMGPSEKKIADYILQNTQQIIDSSISDFAAKCHSGDATVVRFSRRLGFSGFQSLKIGIAREMSERSYVGSAICREDTCFDIFCKRIDEISASLKDTESVLNADDLQRAAQRIMAARRVAVFGLGNSAAVAQDAAHKFLRLGLNAQSSSDNHLQAIIASHLDRDSVLLCISHSGASRDIVEATETAKQHGAFTVALTNFAHSPIAAVADVTLYTKADETKYSILAMSSRIAQLSIVDAIYTYIVVQSDRESVQAVYDTEVSLQSKKMV